MSRPRGLTIGVDARASTVHPSRPRPERTREEADVELETFEEFWAFYVRAHAKRSTRMWHFAGTTAAIGITAAALVTRRWRLLKWAPIAGYGAAWIGHFGFEGNEPATFKHPLWSLRSDFLMWWKILNGTMDAEVERAMAAKPPAAETGNGVDERNDDAAEPSKQNDRSAMN